MMEDHMARKKNRDIEKSYTVKQTVAKLRRLADCVEKGKPFQIQIAGERIYIPAHATFNIELTKAKVLKIQNIPESERVCVDTTSLLHPGEGMLVGSTAMGFALVHAEIFETKFVSSRPFRVNAGDVSAYVLVPGQELNTYRTNYLSELKGGDKVLVVNNRGDARIVSVGRVKIETRPMLRFEIEGEKNIIINCICQNAETIRLVDANGNAKSVVDIKRGDEILVHIGPGATHFGTVIKEAILEK